MDITDSDRYNWLKANVTQRLTDSSMRGEELAEHKLQYVLPKLISYADFCGEISFDEAIDIAINRDKEKKCEFTLDHIKIGLDRIS